MGRRPAERPAITFLLSFWLPVALYVTLTFVLSAQPHLRPPLSFPMSDKVMHILEYGGLGVLLVRATRAGGSRPPRAALVALCLGVVVGTADELFQSTVPGRESSAFDLAADAVGLSLAPLAYRAIGRG